jgi:hypothetical protein
LGQLCGLWFDGREAVVIEFLHVFEVFELIQALLAAVEDAQEPYNAKDYDETAS